jgi:hypothetical protein
VSHDVRLYLSASCEQQDRWLLSPSSNSFLVLSSVALDAGGALLPSPPNVRPERMLVFGDSISEGTNAQNYNDAEGSCGGGYGTRNSASVDSWAFAFGEALGAEVSLAAFAAQGYATRNSLNYGNVPPLLTPGDANASAWAWVRAGVSRLPALAAQPPAFLANALGFNDQNSDVTPQALTSTVAAWLADARAAVGARTTLFVVVPFGGEMRTQNTTRLAIIAGFEQYQQTGGGGGGNGDPCAFLLDLYPWAQRGLQGLGAPTAESCDGTHPLARRHGELGAMLGAAAARALLGADAQCAGSGLKRR